MGKFFRSPWLEVNVMIAVLIISYVALGLITQSAETQPGQMSGGVMWGYRDKGDRHTDQQGEK